MGFNISENPGKNTMKDRINSELGSLKADLVIIGAGGAGLPAAVEASQRGLSVVVLEKRQFIGGNANLASGLFASESPAMERKLIEVTNEECFQTHMNYHHWDIDPLIVRRWINMSGDTIRWIEEMGLIFDWLPNMYPFSKYVTFHCPKKGGSELMTFFKHICEENNVKILLETPATQILKSDNEKIKGVIARGKDKEIRINAKAVFIASGGYAGNKKLLKKHFPHVKKYINDINVVGLPLMGDGIELATNAGGLCAGMGVGMFDAPTHPKMPLDPVLTEPFNVFVNMDGKRYVDESVPCRRWSEAANPLFRQKNATSFVIFDDKNVTRIMEEGLYRGMTPTLSPPGTKKQKLRDTLKAEEKRGRAKIAKTFEELAEWIGCKPEVLKATMDEYNNYCENKRDDKFSKFPRYLRSISTPPFYAVKGHACIVTTLGGIKINDNMEVLNEEFDVVPGLYAGGDLAEGVQNGSSYAYQFVGGTLSFAVNSGRIAAMSAAEYIDKLPTKTCNKQEKNKVGMTVQ